MRFKIETSGNFYTLKDAEKLKALGFRFEPSPDRLTAPWYKLHTDDTDDDAIWREFTTLDELMAFVREWGGACVISESESGDCGLEIYDDYRE